MQRNTKDWIHYSSAGIVQQADSHGLSMPCSRSSETKAGIIQATTGSLPQMANARSS